jgi:hypothetical protein
MSFNRVSRRTFAATGIGFAAGVFTVPFGSLAQEATPQAGGATPVAARGYVSTRLRTVASADARVSINERVVNDFAPEVSALPGFEGYILGDVVDRDDQSISVVAFDEAGQTPAFDEAAKSFVASLDEGAGVAATEQWAGDLLVDSRSVSTATPGATPVAESLLASGYVALRIYASKPGTDGHAAAPLVESGFLPIVSGLAGFEGYLYYPIEGGFVSISLFDSLEAAEASSAAAKDWVAEFLTEFTDGNPRIINSNLIYGNLPIFA